VLKSLVLLGVQEGQLEAVSFGEERPSMPGTDEASMSQNRRVELKGR
jgi:peptidoglycan-associated lipoprotein